MNKWSRSIYQFPKLKQSGFWPILMDYLVSVKVIVFKFIPSPKNEKIWLILFE
jgi:hypothetical protein